MVIPYERQLQIRPHVSGKSISLDGVGPTYKDQLPSHVAWMCDLIKDLRTSRLPYELCLPPRESVIQVLNAPDPPRIKFGINAVGYGIDSINIRFTAKDHSLTFRVPNEYEIIEEIISEAGFRPIKDEKKTRYTQAIEVFGGFLDAARFFSGTSLKILNAFKSKKLTYDQIKGEAKLGKGKEKKTPHFLEWASRLPKHAQKVAKNRYRDFSIENLGKEASENEIIEKLIRLGVLTRKWKLDKCPYCDKDYWVDNLEIQASMFCPGCHNRVEFRDKVQLGYVINELVSLSIEEGIIPVTLTTRFLYNLTDQGFLCVPGIKFKSDSLQTDFDILACCDGHLVAAECKTLDEVPSNSSSWAEVADQVKQQIEVAKIIGIESFIVSAMCDEFPEQFIELVIESTGPSISTFFVNKSDLESGYRHLPSVSDQKRLMRINDILPKPSVFIKRKSKKKGDRIVSF